MAKVFTPSVGQYFYAPYKRQWAVWKKVRVSPQLVRDHYVRATATKAEAINLVSILNGWTK